MIGSKEQKQTYLLENIINKNYDPQEFLEYCQEKAGTVDIDQWNFQDIVKLVNEFVQQKGQIRKEPQFDDPFDSVFSKPSTLSNSGEFTKIINEGTKQIKSSDFDFHSDIKVPVVVPAPINLAAEDFDFLSGNFTPSPPKTKVQSMQKDVDIFNNMGSVNQPPKKKIFNNMTIKKPQINEPIKNVQTKTSQKPMNSQSTKQIPTSVSPKSEPPKSQIPKQQSSSPQKARQPSIVPVPIISTPSNRQQSKLLEMVKQSIPCRKINPKQLLTNSNPYVHIQNHQIVSPSVFLPNYVLYQIRTNPIGIQVRRKYKDFEILRQILGKLYPLTRLPYLNTNNRLSQTEQSSIKRQKYMLESFLNDILLNKQFLSSKIVEQFLTLKDESLFKKKFKDYEKIGEIKSIEDLASLTGTYELFFSEKHYDFCQKIPAFMNVFEAYQQKVRSLYEQLSSSLQNTTKILVDISQTYFAYEQVAQNFNNTNSAIQSFVSLQGTYRSLGELHKQWALSFSEQIKLIDGDIRPGLKFDKQNVIQTTKQIMRIRNNITQSYLKRAKQETSTQKYSSTKLESYKQQLTSPSKNITVLKYQNAYVNSKMASQVGRMFRDLSFKLQKRYGIMAKLQTNIVQNMKSIWQIWAPKAK